MIHDNYKKHKPINQMNEVELHSLLKSNHKKIYRLSRELVRYDKLVGASAFLLFLGTISSVAFMGSVAAGVPNSIFGIAAPVSLIAGQLLKRRYLKKRDKFDESVREVDALQQECDYAFDLLDEKYLLEQRDFEADEIFSVLDESAIVDSKKEEFAKLVQEINKKDEDEKWM